LFHRDNRVQIFLIFIENLRSSQIIKHLEKNLIVLKVKIYRKENSMDRKEYIDKLARQLKQWDDEIEKIEEKAKKSSEETRKKYHEQIEELKQKQEEVKKKLQEVKGKSQGALEELQSGTEEALDSLKDAFRSARDKFKENDGSDTEKSNLKDIDNHIKFSGIW